MLVYFGFIQIGFLQDSYLLRIFALVDSSFKDSFQPSCFEYLEEDFMVIQQAFLLLYLQHYFMAFLMKEDCLETDLIINYYQLARFLLMGLLSHFD
jgi:hypothetical protein